MPAYAAEASASSAKGAVLSETSDESATESEGSSSGSFQDGSATEGTGQEATGGNAVEDEGSSSGSAAGSAQDGSATGSDNGSATDGDGTATGSADGSATDGDGTATGSTEGTATDGTATDGAATGSTEGAATGTTDGTATDAAGSTPADAEGAAGALTDTTELGITGSTAEIAAEVEPLQILTWEEFRDQNTSDYGSLSKSEKISLMDAYEAYRQQMRRTAEGEYIEGATSGSISNSYIDVQVGSDGRYSIGNVEGNPNYDSDDNEKLLYGYPSTGTSTTLININGESRVFTADTIT
jgi:hypothetical protein